MQGFQELEAGDEAIIDSAQPRAFEVMATRSHPAFYTTLLREHRKSEEGWSWCDVKHNHCKYLSMRLADSGKSSSGRNTVSSSIYLCEGLS